MFSRFLTFFIPFFLFFPAFLLASNNSLSGSNSLAAGPEDFLTVEQAYQADLMYNNGQWLVSWQLADKHFLYRHGFANEWLADGLAADAGVTLPDGIKKNDEYFGDVEIYYQQVQIPVNVPSGRAGTLYLKATSQGCADAGLCYPPYSLYFAVDSTGQKATPVSAEVYLAARNNAPSTIPATPSPLAWIFISALLGGLILNLMPCVLPVLSIKVMQLARHPDSPQAHREGLVYMAGVILSFVAVAGLMLALRAGGDAIGWGFQLQNPLFVAGLVYLFFILGLSMSGVLHLGHRWMGMGQSLTGKTGLSGAFFTGVLAVVVASPCTAPFMSAALGYAITQSPLIALLVFAALGLGMALPVTLFSFIPGASRFLPKPGPWMERLKQFFAFPLYATAIWLAWVFGNQTGTLGMAGLASGCLALALAFWCLDSTRPISRLAGLLALIAALALPFSLPDTSGNTTLSSHESFSRARLAELHKQGQPVFVDLTADWCITCKVNEKTTLETAAIQQAFRDAGITYMVGDWTNYNPEITALLNEYQRSGIPLYLLFPGKPGAKALILPQLLTPAIVMEYINKTRVSAH